MPFTYADDPYLAYLQANQMSNLSAQGLEGVNPAYRQMMMDRLANEYSVGGPGAVDTNAPQIFPGLISRGRGVGTQGGNQFSGLQDALGYLNKAKQVSQLSGKLGGPDPYANITDALKEWLGIGTPASEAAPIGSSVGATALPGTEALTASAPEILQGAGLAGYGSQLGAELGPMLGTELGPGASESLGAASAAAAGLGEVAPFLGVAAVGAMGAMANQANIKERSGDLKAMRSLEEYANAHPWVYDKIRQNMEETWNQFTSKGGTLLDDKSASNLAPIRDISPEQWNWFRGTPLGLPDRGSWEMLTDLSGPGPSGQASPFGIAAGRFQSLYPLKDWTPEYGVPTQGIYGTMNPWQPPEGR